MYSRLLSDDGGGSSNATGSGGSKPRDSGAGANQGSGGMIGSVVDAGSDGRIGLGGTGGTTDAATGAASDAVGTSGSGGSGNGSSGGRSGTGGTGTGSTGAGGSGTGGAGTGGAGTGGAGTGGAGTGGAGTGGAGTGGVSGLDRAQYNFENSTQNWTVAVGTPAFVAIAHSTAHQFAGAESLAGSIMTSAAATYILEVRPPTPAIPPGATVTVHVFIPAGAAIAAIQPYVLDDLFLFTGTYSNSFALGSWTTLTVAVPMAATQIIRLGVQFTVTAAWTGTVYVDSISW